MKDKTNAYRLIFYVFVALMALTIAEFFASQLGSTALLFIVALIKTGLIVQFFMHIYRLWREESH